MEAYCEPCQRWFNSWNSYIQHMDNSAAHQYDWESSSSEEQELWECERCDRCFATEQARHQHSSSAANHPYCIPCKRMFVNQNNLTQHQHSKIHMGSSIKCPWCKNPFTTASGVTIHLESGTCSVSGLNRIKINDMVRQLDRGNVITRPMLPMSGYDRVENIATRQAWNGIAYQCYLCARQFLALEGLNKHIGSPAHDQETYHCPKASCNRQYKLLSSLVQHVESETCGVMRFGEVQQQATRGIDNMVGRMIRG